MWFPGTKKDRTIGIDIGSYSVKVCHLSQRQKGIFLEGFGLANLPPSSIVNGTIKEPQVIEGKGLNNSTGS